MTLPPYAEIERIAAELCVRSGGHWLKAGTRKNLWRRRAIALFHLAHGDEASAKQAMRRAGVGR